MNRVKVLIAAGLAAICSLSFGAPNLVTNGNFESGNTSFTSAYSYVAGTDTSEGVYTIANNPSSLHPLFVSAGDHTTGSGLMFVGNGSPTDGDVVWQATVSGVSAATNYFFEAYVMNVCCSAGFTGSNSASVLEFSVNGMTVGVKSTNLANTGMWEGLSTSWNSGLANTAELKLINRNTAASGNDFAIDDISLSTSSAVSPVPEPAEFALLLPGLFLVVALASRRRLR